MLFEHIIYSTAIAIIAGMLWYKYTRRDPSWIIIASAFAPDFDIVAGALFKKLDMNILINGAPIRHGDFHNIAFLLLFATAAALVLRLAGMKFWDSFLFAGIGFGAHMFEDALVANPAYAFLWPLSEHRWGIGLFDYWPDLYGIANENILIVGMISLALCVGIRTLIEGNGCIRRIAKAFGVAAFVMMLMVLVFIVMDIKVLDKMNSYTERSFIDKWTFTQNASWDYTVYHSGKHSAKILVMGNDVMSSVTWVGDKIKVKPNTTYVFSAWGKTDGLGNNSQPSIRVAELNNYDKMINQTRLVFGKGDNEWTKKQARFTSNANTSTVYLKIYIWNGNGAFWLDDVELYDEKSDNNMIPNGGFEDDVKRIIFPIY